MNETKTRGIAEQFLTLVIAGRIDEAFDTYANPSGKHHNVHTAAGFEALREGMKDSDLRFPNKKFEIKQVVGGGDMTATYSHLVMKPGDAGMAVVHIFRINDGKIVEMWDCAQSIPADSLNSDGPF